MTRWAVFVSLLLAVPADAQPVAGRINNGRNDRRVPARPLLAVPAGPKRVDRTGDPLPPGALARYGSSRLRHGAGATALGFTPDGKRLVSLSTENDAPGLRLWEPATGREVHRLDWVIESAALLPDGGVVFGDQDAVRVWTPADGRVRHLRDHVNKVTADALAVAPDGRTVAIAAGTTIHLADLGGGQTRAGLKVPGSNLLNHVGFSPDGRWLAGTGPKVGVLLWDLRTNRRVRTYPVKGDTAEFAFSPDGRRLAIAGEDVLAYPTDAEEPDEAFASHTERVTGLRFSADGASLFLLSVNGAVTRRDAATNELKDTWAAPPGEHEGPAALAPEAAFAASLDPTGGIRLWDPRTGKGPLTDRLPPLYDPGLSADGKTVSCIDDKRTVRVFDRATGAAVKEYKLEGGAEAEIPAAYDPRSGRAVVQADDGEVRVIEATTGTVLARMAAPKGSLMAAFGPADPDRVAVFTEGSVHLIDVPAGRAVRSFPVGQPDNRLDGALSPDGRLVAVTTEPFSVWEVETGRRRFEVGAVPDPDAAVFSADGRMLAVWDGAEIAVVDVRTGTVVRRFRQPGGNVFATCGAFSPDGTRLATGGDEGTIVIWDMATRLPVFGLDRHDGYVNGVSFSADGKTLVSAADDGTALVWDVSGVAAVAPGGPPGVDEAVKLLADVEPAAAQRGMEFLYREPAAAAKRIGERVPVPTAVSADKLAALVVNLGSDEFATRQAAAKELEGIGTPAAGVLREVVRGKPAPEVRKVAERLLLKIEGVIHRPEDLRALRAVEVLEVVGTADAKELLRRWAAGPPGFVQTAEAAKALKRLDPQTPSLRPPAK